MELGPSAQRYVYSSAFLMVFGWAGLGLMLFFFNVPPLVWARWGFFALWFIALSGTALPVAYYLNLRFPSDTPIEPATIVRQSMWVGVYGSVLAWLQLGRVLAFWMWMGLAAGLIGIEYLVRLRERSRWHPPAAFDEEPGRARDSTSPSDAPWAEKHEPSR